MLPNLEGSRLNDFPQKAVELYRRLSKALSRFVSVEVTWGHRRTKLPLWKILYANFSRLNVVGDALNSQKRVTEEASRLEDVAQKVIGELLDNPV